MSAATDVMAELASLEDAKLRAANEERGDDHGVNLSAMRAVWQKSSGPPVTRQHGCWRP
jgi:hypothetical protein